MSDRTIHIFTHHAEEAQHWVNALCEDLDWPSDKRGYHLLRAVLHALRDWLSPEELADFSAQLPVLVRGVLFEGWDPAALPVIDRSREDFFANSLERNAPRIFPTFRTRKSPQSSGWWTGISRQARRARCAGL